MKLTVCERAMWFILARPSFQYILRMNLGWDMHEYKEDTKRIFREIIARTPDIGRLKENPIRVCLSAGIVWLAAYEAAQGKMDEKVFSEMVIKSMEAPLIQMSFKAKCKNAFKRESQEKQIARSAKINQIKSQCNWDKDMKLGRDAEEYTITYHRCGLCGLGKQEGLFHLVKYMCVLDYRSVELMGGSLYRTQTLAQGGECCDFYICRKGSKWDVQHEMKDEILNPYTTK